MKTIRNGPKVEIDEENDRNLSAHRSQCGRGTCNFASDKNEIDFGLERMPAISSTELDILRKKNVSRETFEWSPTLPCACSSSGIGERAAIFFLSAAVRSIQFVA